MSRCPWFIVLIFLGALIWVYVCAASKVRNAQLTNMQRILRGHRDYRKRKRKPK